jgi:hypothetical protein
VPTRAGRPAGTGGAGEVVVTEELKLALALFGAVLLVFLFFGSSNRR